MRAPEVRHQDAGGGPLDGDVLPRGGLVEDQEPGAPAASEHDPLTQL